MVWGGGVWFVRGVCWGEFGVGVVWGSVAWVGWSGVTAAERSELGKALEVLRLAVHGLRAELSAVAEQLEGLQGLVDGGGG